MCLAAPLRLINHQQQNFHVIIFYSQYVHPEYRNLNETLDISKWNSAEV